jgi:UTP:GlnB (protein PII) uridylyltransferase
MAASGAARHSVAVMPRADYDWASKNPEQDVVPSAFVEGFVASMPARYGFLFEARAIRRHAGVSFRRGERPAHVELWRSLPDGSAAFCVVAQDRPGVLSAIAAALVLHKLDVITALVFSRPLSCGTSEAVDLVWVRRVTAGDTAAIDGDEADSIGEVLSAILSGSISVEHIASRAFPLPPGPEQSVVVRFEPIDDDGLAALVVEAPDRPGILLTIALELFQQGAQIARSLVRTSDGRAFNRFEVVEFSGAPLTDERREQIRNAVFAALALTEPSLGSP